MNAPQATAERELPPDEVDALLAEMAQSGQRAASGLSTGPQRDRATGLDPKNRDHNRPAVGARPPSTLRYSHDAMIDVILSNPRIKNAELAGMFGYTQSWVSTIQSSNAFKARMAMRRELLVDPYIKDAVEDRIMGSTEKAEAVLNRSLEILQEKLSASVSGISDEFALRAAQFGAKTLGLGGNAPPAPPPIDPNRLESLAERLLALQGRHSGSRDVSDAVIVRDE